MRDDDRARAEFHRFFEDHHQDLARLAYLMLQDPDLADDMAADAMVAAWHQWDRVRGADEPLAYVRRIVINMSKNHVRSRVRERSRLAFFWQGRQPQTVGPDVPAVVDVRTALRHLPAGKRACVVLRFAFDLSEAETAEVLGISVGTVKSQTSRGVTELEKLLVNGVQALSGATGRDGGE